MYTLRKLKYNNSLHTDLGQNFLVGELYVMATKRNIMRKITLLFSLLLFITTQAAARDENETVTVAKADPEIVEAIKQARATLDPFLKKQANKVPDVNEYKLKVKFSDANGTEHFWVQPFINLGGGNFKGVLANAPEFVKSLRQGQLVEFSRDMISDWGYVENGIQYGSYTVCALFKKMPQEQVEYYRKNHGFQC